MKSPLKTLLSAVVLAAVLTFAAVAAAADQFTFSVMVANYNNFNLTRVESGSMTVTAEDQTYSTTFIQPDGALTILAPREVSSSWLLQSGAFNDRNFRLDVSESGAFTLYDADHNVALEMFQQDDGSYVFYYSSGSTQISDRAEEGAPLMGPAWTKFPLRNAPTVTSVSQAAMSITDGFDFNRLWQWYGDSRAPGLVCAWTDPGFNEPAVKWYYPLDSTGDTPGGITWTSHQEGYNGYPAFLLNRNFNYTFITSRPAGTYRLNYWFEDPDGRRSNQWVEYLVLE